MNDIKFFQGNLHDLSMLLIKKRSRGEPLTVDFLNIHGYALSLSDDLFASCQRDIDIIVRDGVGLRLLRKWLGTSEIGQRIPGPSFFEHFLKVTGDVNHLFLGGSEETQQLLCRKYLGASNIRVIPVGNLYYDRSVMEEFSEGILSECNAFRPTYVWVGLGCPKQNLLASILKRKIQCQAILCVGAAFSYHVGSLPDCPTLIRQFGLESFWRFCLEPHKISRRIFSSLLTIVRRANP